MLLKLLLKCWQFYVGNKRYLTKTLLQKTMQLCFLNVPKVLL